MYLNRGKTVLLAFKTRHWYLRTLLMRLERGNHDVYEFGGYWWIYLTGLLQSGNTGQTRNRQGIFKSQG